MVGGLGEELPHMVGREQHRSARSTVHERRQHGLPHVGFTGEVAHRVVHEDHVELTVEPQGAHIALEVLALGVQLPAHR